MTNPEISRCSPEIEDILSQLAEEEVISLATTITGGLLKSRITTRQGAVKAVLSYSKDVESILKRKLFTREKLLSYLYEKNVAVNLPITKHEIIGKILKLWNIEYKECKEGIVSNDDNTTRGLDLDDSSLESSNFDSQNQCSTTTTPEACKNLQIIGSSQNVETSIQESNTCIQSTVNVLGKEFSQWFYKLLNDNQLTSDHFFPDVSLNLTLQTSEQVNHNISSDPEAVTNCLLTTKLQYDLFFNPNLSEEGLKSQMDPHGLVMVIVCGTLHSKNVCVGVFEQMFALARDPFTENNWKIKRTDLRLKSSSHITGSPTLCDTNISSSNNHISIND